MNFRHLRQERRGDTFGERNLKNADGGEERSNRRRENTYDESGAKKRRRRIGIGEGEVPGKTRDGSAWASEHLFEAATAAS